MGHMARKFHVIIREDPEGGYIGNVPELSGCLSQGDTLDELMTNIREAIELCIEVESEDDESRFVGIQEITV